MNGNGLALAVFPKADYNGAFNEDYEHFDSLLNRGYRILVCEADRDMEVARRVLFAGRDHFDPREGRRLKYGLLLLGGHGTMEGINYSSGGIGEFFVALLPEIVQPLGFLQNGNFDTRDWWKDDFGPDAWETRMDSDGVSVLISCSTGEERKNNWWTAVSDFGWLYWMMGRPSYGGNMMGMVGEMTERPSFAPAVPTSLKDFIYDPTNGKVIGATYYEGKTNAWRPEKNQKK
jgi:hypothetical protein